MNLPDTHIDLPDEDDGPGLWNPDVAGVWSVFLKPVFGSVILLLNWETIGDTECRLARPSLGFGWQAD